MTEDKIIYCFKCKQQTPHILIEENKSPENETQNIVLSVWRCQICMKIK